MAQVESDRGTAASRALPAAIVLLAFVDGMIHLSLDFILFHGRLFADVFSVLFVLNFLGYLTLIAAFILSARSARWQRLAVDGAMIAYVAVTFVAWLVAGRPNPFDLGYLSKFIEVVLVVALTVHLLTLRAGVREAEPWSMTGRRP